MAAPFPESLPSPPSQDAVISPVAIVLRRAGCSKKNAAFGAALFTVLLGLAGFIVWIVEEARKA